MTPTPGQTYSTPHGDLTVLELRPQSGGILVRRADLRHVLMGLADWEGWNPQPFPAGTVLG